MRDLSALAPVIADARVLKVLHGADYDVTTLKRDFGFAFAGIFDTMLAARFLGLPAVGLQAVAQGELGIALSQGQPEGRLVAPSADAHAGALRARRRAPPARAAASG